MSIKNYDTNLEKIIRNTVDAYIRFLPRYYGEMIYTGMTAAPGPRDHPRAPLNHFGYRRNLADDSFYFVVRVNNDTMYGGGWFDLSEEPFVIKVPDTGGRFWSIQINTRWTEALPGIGSRRGSPYGTYALVGPNWKGELPDRVQRVNCPENLMFVICRIGYRSFDDSARSAADLDQAGQMLRRFTAVPLSKYMINRAPEQAPASEITPPPPVSPRSYTAAMAESQPLTLLGMILDAVTKPDCPLSVDEKDILDQFREDLNIALSESSTLSSDQPTATAMIEGLHAARRLIDTRIRAAKSGDNGWVTIPAGKWDDRWIDRAAVAEYAIWANRPDASVYPETHTDGFGMQLDGKYNYIIHFAANKFPPVDDFWSITLYRGDSLTLVKNPINRFSIGDRTPGLIYNKDGSLDIYIQKDRPQGDKAANWLPCGDKEFNLMTRLYGPSPSILDGSYKLPPVMRTDEIAFLKGEGKL